MALPIRPSKNTPIPNNPFYSVEEPYINGAYFPVVAGTGTEITLTGAIPTISVTGGGGGGTVTSIIAGTGLDGGTITTSGTISLADTAVTPGSYTYASLTVDQQGRITAASDGTPPAGGTVTSITAGTGLTGGTITTSGTIDLADTAVTPGSYTYGSFTVDAQGRLTAASDGTAPNTTVTAPITNTGTAVEPVIGLADTAVTPGSYTYASLTVDAQGRLTAASDGAAPVASVSVTSPITDTGTATAPNIGVDTATTGQLGVVQVGTNIDVAAGVISVKSSSTSQAGLVQLNDTVTSTSTTEALTAAQGKVLQDQIDALLVSSNLTLAGTLDTTTGNLVTVTTEGASAGFSIGLPLPAASVSNDEYFVIVTVPATSYTPPGGSATETHIGDWFLSNGTAWEFLNVGNDPGYASTTTPGVVQLATTADVQAGTDSTLAVTPTGAAATYIPFTAYTAKGTILSASAASTTVALPVGSNGKVLAACSTTPSGLFWADACQGTVTNIATGTGLSGGPITNTGTINLADTTVTPGTYLYSTITVDQQGRITAASDGASPILPSSFTAKGDILAGTGASTFSALATGTAGQVLSVDTTTPSGLKWITLAPSGVASVTGSAPIVVDNTDPANPVIQVNAASTLQSGVVRLNDTVTSTLTTQAATANAVKTAYDLAAAAVPCSSFLAKGDLLAGDGAGTYSALGVGTNGQVLSANSGCSEGLEWVASCQGTVTSITAGTALYGGTITTSGTISLGDTPVTPGTYNYATLTVDQQGRINAASDGVTPVLPSDFAAKGDILAGTGAGAYTAFPAGTNGQTLIANSACSNGLEWVSVVPGSVASVTGTAPITVDNTDPQNPIVEVDAASTTQVGVVQLYDDVDSTSTTEAATANAVKTAYDLADAAVPDASYTASGDILVGTGAGTYVALSSGPANSFLSSDGAGTLSWITQSPGDVTTVSGTAPIVVDNTDPQNPVITVNGASTTTPGVVQLNDTVTSTSTSQAATANAVKQAYDAAKSSIQSIVGLAPVQIDPENPQDPKISVDVATTSSVGVVQLSDSTSTTSSTLAATSTAVKSAYDLAAAAIPRSTFTATGEIIVGTGSGSYTALPVGSNDSILVADSACTGGVKWISSSPGAVDSVTGTAPITVDNTDPNNPIVGVDVATALATGVVSIGANIDVDGAGEISVASASTTVAGVVQLNDAVTSTSTTEAATANAVKQAYDAALDSVQSVTGTAPVQVDLSDPQNPDVSVDAASTTASGVVQLNDTVTSTSTTEAATANAVKTAYDLADAAIPESTFTTKGELILGTGTASYTALPVGANNTILVADSTCASGVKWTATTPGAVDSVTGNAPITVDNTDPNNPVVEVDVATTTSTGVVSVGSNIDVTAGGEISVASASTTTQGVVQLSDSVTSTSTTEAATANAVKQAYDAAAAAVQAVTGTTPIQVDLTDPQNPDVSVDAASTTAAGVVQLNDSVTSTSTTQAATANAVKQAYDAASAAVQSVTGTAPIQVDLTDPQNPDVSVDAASTSAAGVVQLNDTVTSTSTTEAATANAVKQAYDAATSSVQSVTGTGPIQVDATDPQNPDISVDAASTTAAGVVQLNDTVTSTSDTEAATANAVKTAYDLADAAIPKSCVTAKGTLVTGTAANTPTALSVGTDGQVLIACSAATSGLCWITISTSPATPTAFGTIKGTTDNLSGNTSIGCNAFNLTATGNFNTAVGFNALVASTTSFRNTALGACALLGATTGSENTAIGWGALRSITTGGCNTAVGHGAAFQASGRLNTAIGFGSGNALLTGSCNTSLGYNAGGITDGCNNVAIGSLVCVASETGSCQLAIGFAAGQNWLTGDCTKAIRPGAGIIDCAGSCGTAGQALLSTGANSVCWGTVSADIATPTSFGTLKGTTNNTSANTSLGCNSFNLTSTGVCNTAVGTNSLVASTTGVRNTAVGAFNMCALTTGSENTTLGWGALRNNTTGSSNTAVGHGAAFQASGSSNTAIGFGAGNALLTGSWNVSLGANSGGVTDGCCNVSIGNFVCVDSPTGNCQLAIGFAAGQNWLTGDCTKAIRPGAGIIDCSGSCGTAGQALLSTGSNGVCWGTASAPVAAPTSFGTLKGTTNNTSGNTSLGCNSFNLTATGGCNTAMGLNALVANTTGVRNTAVGACSLCSVTTGGENTALGWGTLRTLSTGSSNTAVGHGAAFQASGSLNTAIGFGAGNALLTGSCNVSLGYNAGGVTDGCCNVSIGNFVCVPSATGSCQLAIGYAAGQNWLTGLSTKAIKPGAGIVDSINSCGSANQVLTSTGSNSLIWRSINTSVANPNYGSYYSTQTQTVSTVGSGQPVTVDTTVGQNGVSVSGGNSFNIPTTGKYNIQFSLQLLTTTASTKNTEVWFVNNNVAIPNSNTRFVTRGSNEAELAALNFVDTFTAGDVIQIYWASDDGDMTLAATTSLFDGPDIPSAIITIVPVGA